MLSGQPTSMYIRRNEVRQSEHPMSDIARYLLTLKVEDVATGGSEVKPAHADDPAFVAAWPSSLFTRLPCLPEARPG